MWEADYVTKARADALEKALSLPLPDAVYEVVRHNEWVRGPGTAHRISLTELQVKGSLTDLEEWQRRSFQLRGDAYAVGDAGLRRDGSYDEARAQFVSRNPGFGDVSYNSAIEHGYRSAR